MPTNKIRHANEMSADTIHSRLLSLETPSESFGSSSAASASASSSRSFAASMTLVLSGGVSAPKPSGNSGSASSSSVLCMSSKTARAAGVRPATVSSSSARINVLRCTLLLPSLSAANDSKGLEYYVPALPPQHDGLYVTCWRVSRHLSFREELFSAAPAPYALQRRVRANEAPIPLFSRRQEPFLGEVLTISKYRAINQRKRKR